MLKVRIIPTLLWKNFGLVKGRGFNSWRRIGSILPAVKVFNTRQVDELIIMDISATEELRDPDYEMVAEIAHECFVPLTIGGGISRIEHIKKLLQLGADKISINSAALRNPELITEAANRFGVQCIVVSIDAIQNTNGEFYCAVHAGKKETSVPVLDWAAQVAEKGAGEILLTDVKFDGTMQGYNQDLIKKVASVVSIPVIASGGAGKLSDFSDAIHNGASALAAASLFQFTELTPMEIKQFLELQKIPIRKSQNVSQNR